jgi:hypothetical protein
VKSTLPLLGALVVATAGTAAASDDGYAPPGATQRSDGYRSVVVATSRGAVELVAFGIAELTPREATAMRALHIRMAITNIDAPVPWSIDVTTARLEIDGRSERPLFVNSDIATLPIAIIDRGEHRVLDFYFAVPEHAAREADLAAFDFLWQLKTPDRALGSRTRFAGPDTGAPPPTEIALPAGWGGHWWIDATYPWPLFDHHDGPITHRSPSAVVITRPPRWPSR